MNCLVNRNGAKFLRTAVQAISAKKGVNQSSSPKVCTLVPSRTGNAYKKMYQLRLTDFIGS